jgi:hypothetical protein
MQARNGNGRRATVDANASQVNGSNFTTRQLMISSVGPHLPRSFMIPPIPALSAGCNDLEHGCAQTQARDAPSVEIIVRSLA